MYLLKKKTRLQRFFLMKSICVCVWLIFYRCFNIWFFINVCRGNIENNMCVCVAHISWQWNIDEIPCDAEYPYPGDTTFGIGLLPNNRRTQRRHSRGGQNIINAHRTPRPRDPFFTRAGEEIDEHFWRVWHFIPSVVEKEAILLFIFSPIISVYCFNNN